MKSVIEASARLQYPAWAELAAEHGFYDQSHLNREFRDIAGVTPGAYKPLSAESALHMELPAKKQPPE